MTALAGAGSTSLADEVHEVAHILLQTWPQQVAAPIANEIHNVLTQTRSGLLTLSVILAIYFSSSGVEAVRIGLNRAYDVRDSRPWWLLRLESIAYIFVGAFALLTLAFLVVLAPLIRVVVLHFAPGLEPLNRLITFGRFPIASLVLLLARVLAHKFLPAGQRSATRHCSRNFADLRHSGSPLALPSVPTLPNSRAITSQPTRVSRR